MKILKEIEIEVGDIRDQDLFDEFEDRIESCDVLYKKEIQEKLSPIKEQMQSKLEEIYRFVSNPSQFI